MASWNALLNPFLLGSIAVKRPFWESLIGIFVCSFRAWSWGFGLASKITLGGNKLEQLGF